MVLRDEEMLALVRDSHFVTTTHAVARMNERGVTAEDVRSVAATPSECRWQEANSTWRVTGSAADGDRLVVVIGVHSDTLTLVKVLNWEKAEEKRLDLATEVAMRASFAERLGVVLEGTLSALRGTDAAPEVPVELPAVA